MNTQTLIVILLPFTISLATVLYKNFMARLPAEKQAILKQIGKTVVNGIEQSAKAGIIPMSSEARKAAAMSAFYAFAKTFHLSVPKEVQDIIIEDIVATLPPTQQPQPAPVVTTRSDYGGTIGKP